MDKLKPTAKQKQIFKTPELLDAFVKYVGNKAGGDVAVYKIYLYRDIRNYRRKPQGMLLAEAHIIHQKYLIDDPLYDPQIPDKLKKKVDKILWADEDGADKDELVDIDLFWPVDRWLEPQIATLLNSFESTQNGKEIIMKISDPNVLDNSPKPVRRRMKKRKDKKINSSSHLFDVEAWTIQDICSWLENIGYGKYSKLFEENVIDGKVLLEIDDEDLTSINIDIVDREGIMQNINKLKMFISTIRN